MARGEQPGGDLGSAEPVKALLSVRRSLAAQNYSIAVVECVLQPVFYLST